ncbi:MAG: glycosyltransferase [Snowella sp.]|nr:glycosyltransferase [Snowella sp.]
MKILFVIPALGSVYGGPSQCVLDLAEVLGRQGVDLDIVTTTANGANCLNIPTQIWMKENFYRIQYFSYSNFIDYKFSWSLSRWLFQNISNYDLVHTHAIFSYPTLPAHLSCRLYKIPYLMTPHGMLEPWALCYKSRKKKLYFNLFEKPSLQRASAIQILASTEAINVKQLGLKSPLVLVPNGIYHNDFQELPNSEIFYQKFPETRNKTLILFLGRIDPKKGLDLLAIAFEKVHAQFPETHLVLAGPDNINFSPTVKAYFSEVNCLDSLTFTGMLTGNLKYATLAAADIYVAPSYSEGFSVSILEGMASGLPCVITTGCNFPEATREKAALVVDIDSTQIGNALLWCLAHPEESKKMGDRARKLIFEKYTWNNIGKIMIETYKNIVNKNP